MNLDPDNYWKDAQNGTPQGASELKALLADALPELRARLGDLQARPATDKILGERMKCQLLIDRINLFLSANDQLNRRAGLKR